MKKAFIVTSSIDVDNNYPLTYSKTRSFFSNEERLRHTVFTINSLDHVSDDETDIYLIDNSDNYYNYKSVLSYQKNLIYVPIKEFFPDVYQLARTHNHKTFCETLITTTFLTHFKKEVDKYDFFFKLSGRYFLDSSFKIDIFNQSNINKFFFKKPLKFEWQDHWPYQMVDRRTIQGDNKLYQYCSVLFGWGKNCHHKMMDIYKGISVFTDNPNTSAYDMETLLYYFTRDYEKDIIETDWTIYGWEGACGGTFLRY